MFEIAVKGSDDEKIAAATILCGASLIRGWNVQVNLFDILHSKTIQCNNLLIDLKSHGNCRSTVLISLQDCCHLHYL